MEEENKNLEGTNEAPVEESNQEPDNNGKQTKTIPPVLFVLLLLLFFGIGVFLGKVVFGGENKDKRENAEGQTNTETTNTEINNTEIPTNNTIDTSVINELVNIAGFNSDVTDGFFAPLIYNDGIINDLSNERKTNIIYVYALRNNMLGEVTGKEYDRCIDGSRSCPSIKKTEFEEIIKKYGMTSFTPDCLNYQDMYLFTYGGSTSDYSKVTQEYTYEVVNEDIIFTDTIQFTAASYTINTVEDKKEVKEFIFKKNSEIGYYYLYSVYTK